MGRPRIGIDARMIRTRQSGLGRYARALVEHLPAADPGSRYVVILRPGIDAADMSLGDNVEVARVPGWLDYPRNLLCGRAINRLGLDLYHSLHHFLPLALRVPRVVATLHDLIWVEHARLTFDVRLAWLRWRAVRFYGTATMRHLMHRADHVISISHHSRRRALERYRLAPERITTVHHGVDHALFVDPEGDPSGEPDTGSPYLLSLGNSKPYKNVRGLLRAFALVAPRHPGLRLLITGRGDSNRSLARLATRLGFGDRVRFTGMVDQASLGRLYKEAVALVFPSFIEGFGFPPLEAMTAGCPVVTSDIPVIRETVGEAGVYADPNDPGSIARAMERVLEEPALRDDLRRRGREQAARFTWGRCAEETSSVHRRLLGR